MRATGNPAGTAKGTATQYWRWEDAGGLVAPAVALALWIGVLVGIAAPLGTALGRLEAGRAPAAPHVAARAPRPMPPRGLASAAAVPDAPPCP